MILNGFFIARLTTCIGEKYAGYDALSAAGGTLQVDADVSIGP